APAMPAANHVNDRMASSRGFSRLWLGELYHAARRVGGRDFLQACSAESAEGLFTWQCACAPAPRAGAGGEGGATGTEQGAAPLPALPRKRGRGRGQCARGGATAGAAHDSPLTPSPVGLHYGRSEGSSVGS